MIKVTVDDLYSDDELMDAFRAFIGLTSDAQLMPDNWMSMVSAFEDALNKTDYPFDDGYDDYEEEMAKIGWDVWDDMDPISYEPAPKRSTDVSEIKMMNSEKRYVHHSSREKKAYRKRAARHERRYAKSLCNYYREGGDE